VDVLRRWSGEFTRQEVVVGHGWHEARLADLDGDGDLDLLNKPYNWDTPGGCMAERRKP
jgi:hypothetical protein